MSAALGCHHRLGLHPGSAPNSSFLLMVHPWRSQVAGDGSPLWKTWLEFWAQMWLKGSLVIDKGLDWVKHPNSCGEL